MSINLILCGAALFEYKLNVFSIKKSLSISIDKLERCFDFVTIGITMLFDAFFYQINMWMIIVTFVIAYVSIGSKSRIHSQDVNSVRWAE